MRAVAATTGLASITGNVGGRAKRAGESLSSVSPSLPAKKADLRSKSSPDHAFDQLKELWIKGVIRSNEKFFLGKTRKKNFFEAPKNIFGKSCEEQHRFKGEKEALKSILRSKRKVVFISK